MQILLAGAESERDDVGDALIGSGFVVTEVGNALELMRALFTLRPDAVITSSRLTGIDGLEMIRIVRAATDVPIVVLGTHRSQHAAAQVLDAGADDYLD